MSVLIDYEKVIAKKTPKEIIAMMSDGSALAKVRSIFYHEAARIEQAEANNRYLSPITRRRMEFVAALRIMEALGISQYTLPTLADED